MRRYVSKTCPLIGQGYKPGSCQVETGADFLPACEATLRFEDGRWQRHRLLTEYMYNASEFELAGNLERAIAIFQEFLALESSPLHRDIAAGEIERLRNASGT